MIVKPPGLLALRVVGLLVCVGCSNRPARVVAPAIDVDAVVDRIMEEGDQNSDGIFAKEEFSAIPAIEAAVSTFDANGDNTVSRDELSNWFMAIKESRIGMVSCLVEVRHQRRPLANVAVRLVPDPVMGGTIQEAAGETDSDGVAAVVATGAPVPGVHCGLYRVEITGSGNDGKPLPDTFNTATRLGVAIGCDQTDAGSIMLNLK